MHGEFDGEEEGARRCLEHLRGVLRELMARPIGGRRGVARSATKGDDSAGGEEDGARVALGDKDGSGEAIGGGPKERRGLNSQGRWRAVGRVDGAQGPRRRWQAGAGEPGATRRGKETGDGTGRRRSHVRRGALARADAALANGSGGARCDENTTQRRGKPGEVRARRPGT